MTSETSVAAVDAKSQAQRAKRSLRAMVDLALEYGGMGSFDHLLAEVAGLHPYKPFQALLILLQRPGASYLLPPDEWHDRFGRAIRPGEQPIVMLQPGGPVMFQFDVSQTEPVESTEKTLPFDFHPFVMAPEVPAESAVHWLVENALRDGVRVTSARQGLGRAGCIWRVEPGRAQRVVLRRRPPEEADLPVRFETLVNAAFNPTERLATLAHELGHLFCGHIGSDRQDWWPDRRGLDEDTVEFEARTVATVVMRRLLPSRELPPAARPHAPEPHQARGLEVALVAAGRVLEMCEGFVLRRTPGSPRSP